MDEEMNAYLDANDVLEACRVILPTASSVLSYNACRVEAFMPGALSLLMRVIANVQLADESTTEMQFVVKLLPLDAELKMYVTDRGFHQNEVNFYRDVLPELKKRVDYQLPLVRCLFVHEKVIFMEDLSAIGYRSCISNLEEPYTNMTPEAISRELARMRLVVRNLAELHAASLGINWPDKMPTLNENAAFKSPLTTVHRDLLRLGLHCLYDDNVDHWKIHKNWPDLTQIFEKMMGLSQPVLGQLNVLIHGDLHSFNMMFTYEPGSNEPKTVKFFDLQSFHYAAPWIDLLTYFYTSVNLDFLAKHEQELLKTYVEALNAAACTTPDPIPSLEEFVAQYNSARIYGFGMAIISQQYLYKQRVLCPGNFDKYFCGLRCISTKFSEYLKSSN